MKISNDALYYIRHKITETKDKKYIELEDNDWSKFENIIRTFEKDHKEVDYDLENYKRRLLEWNMCPYKVLLELKNSYSYRKKATGKAKLNEAITNAFPNLGEITVVATLRRTVENLNVQSKDNEYLLRHIKCYPLIYHHFQYLKSYQFLQIARNYLYQLQFLHPLKNNYTYG